MVNSNRYVFCLKWGTKYSADYVNRLFNMVERYLTPPYTFVCFTDNTLGIDPKIKALPVPNIPAIGWWYKLWFLSDATGFSGTALFLDLDIVICKSLDKFFTYASGEFCIIRDFNRHVYKNWDRMNSSVFRVELGSLNSIYQDYLRHPTAYMQQFKGDQDFMFDRIKQFKFWPDDWIQSYKWEMRDKSQLQYINGKFNFTTPAEPTVLSDTSIAVFHGSPNPHESIDPWVIQHWR